MAFIDWIIIVLYLLLSLGIGLYYRHRAGKSTSDFFLGGRNMPWFVAGISMVATTFAADTPLAVNEIVYSKGISGNWLWWCGCIGGMLTVFFFSRLWRRSGVMTEVELIELRYAGKPASVLRGFRAIYLGVIMNTIILGWVNVAMMTVLKVYFNISDTEALLYVGGCMVLTSLYSSISGLWGVAITDMVQFVIAMAGCIILAVIIVNSPEVGGITGMKAKLPASTLNFLPSFDKLPGALSLSVGAFLAFIGIQWWASWYPGAEPGGGGYIAQRMMSAKNEKHAIAATLFFQVAHYCLRPWPWILVGLCTIIIYPELSGATQQKEAYVHAMHDYLPPGLQGLLLVAFLAAYMSTISTQLNWGTSYVVNDLYRRFIKPDGQFGSKDEAEKHYVKMSRIMTMVLMVFALAVTPLITSVEAAWSFILECGAGLGLVLILRWWWWRINAWAEIAGTIAPFVMYSICHFIINPMIEKNDPAFFAETWEPNRISYFITVTFTVLVIIVTTYYSKPEPMEKLRAFYDKVRPGGWWSAVAGTDTRNKQTGGLVMCWLMAIVFTYAMLFFFGKLILQEWTETAICAGVAATSGLLLKYFVGRTRIMED
jgi:Na+/proline symporter